MSGVLPLHCVHCGAALAVEVEPSNGETPATGFICAACGKSNPGDLGGRVVSVRAVRPHPESKIEQIH